MNLYDKAHELARAIRNSQEFQELKQAKEKVDQDPDAKRMLEDFRKRQWDLEAKMMTGNQPTQEERDALQKLHDVIQMHQAIRNYLQAEYRFSVIVGDVQKIIGESIREIIESPF
jgi:cell fate (sporulation/competence/biofilm development) regulator YlbF (YheA/YmcA/DUF963 family)